MQKFYPGFLRIIVSHLREKRQKQMDVMSVSRLIFRQNGLQRSPQAVLPSTVLWHPIYPSITKYQNLSNLDPPELRKTGLTICFIHIANISRTSHEQKPK